MSQPGKVEHFKTTIDLTMYLGLFAYIVMLVTGSVGCQELHRLRQQNNKRVLFRRPVPISTSSCDKACPCCNSQKYPEFLQAVDAYDASSDGFRCYSREDNDSDLLAVIRCDPYAVAYMSYDYSGVFDNRNAERYCGTSASAREFLTRKEAKACERVIADKLDRKGANCGDEVFGCE